MSGLTIDQLIFKGTHNSYANRGRQAPWMNHAPAKQIDDFGVWSIELDYSIEVERGGPVAVVYPEAVWYSWVDPSDIDEIVESHLRDGQVVERLVLPDSVGR